MDTVFAACGWFFSNMARKVVDFRACFWVRFSVRFLGQAYWRVQPKYPFLDPKIWTPSRSQKHNSDCKIICVRLTSGAVPWMFVEWCFREKRGKIKSRIQEEWSQAASRYAPTQKRRTQYPLLLRVGKQKTKWIFRACFWVRFSCRFLGQAYWRVQPKYPFLDPNYGLRVGAKNWLQLFVSASLATSRAGPLERFHECLLSGASGKNAARSSHVFKNEVKQQADVRPRRRGGHSIRLFACEQAEDKESRCSSLVRHRAAWNHQRTPFQQRLGAQMHGFCCLCGWFFFKHGAQSCGFSGLAFGCVFRAVFGAGLLTCAAKVPIFGLKIWTPSWGQKTQLQLLVPASWRPVALELWTGSMNVCWVVLPRKTRQDQVTHFRSQAASRYAPYLKRFLELCERRFQMWGYWICMGLTCLEDKPVLATECCVFVGIQGAPTFTEACPRRLDLRLRRPSTIELWIWWSLPAIMFTEPHRGSDNLSMWYLIRIIVGQ